MGKAKAFPEGLNVVNHVEILLNFVEQKLSHLLQFKVLM